MQKKEKCDSDVWHRFPIWRMLLIYCNDILPCFRTSQRLIEESLLCCRWWYLPMKPLAPSSLSLTWTTASLAFPESLSWLVQVIEKAFCKQFYYINYVTCPHKNKASIIYHFVFWLLWQYLKSFMLMLCFDLIWLNMFHKVTKLCSSYDATLSCEKTCAILYFVCWIIKTKKL